VHGRRSRPRCRRRSERLLVIDRVFQMAQAIDQRRRKRVGDHIDCRLLAARRLPAGQQGKRQPPDAIVFGAGMGHEIPRDPREPARPERIEAREFERVHERSGRGFRGSVTGVHQRIVKTAAHREPIGERPQPAQRRGIRLRERRLGIGRPGQRAGAGSEGLDDAGVHPSLFPLLLFVFRFGEE
jgi:hypothetical protein